MKYMGSKNRIAKYILPFLQEYLNGENYFVDAFCGGCNLIDKLDYPHKIANDKNKFLVAMFDRLVRNIPYLTFPDKITREYYNKVRECYKTNNNEFSDAIIGWVGFMGSYNGRFFDGGYSGHNVKGRDYIGEQIKNTFLQARKLRNVVFTSKSYRELCIPSCSVIYCDPPYKGTKQYSTSNGFDHDKFWQWCRDMTAKGHKVFVSEYQAPEDFKCIWEMEVTNSMSTKNTYKPIEKLFTYEQ